MRENLRLGAREVEREADGFVGELPVVVQEENVAGLSRELLLDRKLAVPEDGLIQNAMMSCGLSGLSGVWANARHTNSAVREKRIVRRNIIKCDLGG